MLPPLVCLPERRQTKLKRDLHITLYRWRGFDLALAQAPFERVRAACCDAPLDSMRIRKFVIKVVGSDCTDSRCLLAG